MNPEACIHMYYYRNLAFLLLQYFTFSLHSCKLYIIHFWSHFSFFFSSLLTVSVVFWTNYCFRWIRFSKLGIFFKNNICWEEGTLKIFYYTTSLFYNYNEHDYLTFWYHDLTHIRNVDCMPVGVYENCL